MYSKLFGSIFDGSLYGKFEPLTVFMAMLAMCDHRGVVDASPQRIAGSLGAPLDFVQRGIEALEAPDPMSRTPDEDGRRIVRLLNEDGQPRPFGWRIVNYAKYRAIRHEEDRRAYQREWDRLNRGSGVGRGRNLSDDVGNCRIRQNPTHTEADTDIYIKHNVGLTPDHAPRNENQVLRQKAVEILTFLNQKAGKHYQPVKANIDLIVGLLKQGTTPDDIRAVIAKKVREWKGKPDMEMYLRPATLFGPRNFFAKYSGEIPPERHESEEKNLICPECNRSMKHGEDRCRCGWVAPKGPPPIMEIPLTARYCKNALGEEIRAAYRASRGYKERHGTREHDGRKDDGTA